MIKITLGAYSYKNPQEINSLIRHWLERATRPERIEVIISLESDDDLFEEYSSLLSLIENEYSIAIKIITGINPTWVKGVNRIKDEFSGDVIIICPNNSECSPGWDDIIDDAYSKMPGSYVIKTNDSNPIKIPVFTSSYLKHKMWIYYPGYHSFFHEMELSAVIAMENKIIELPELNFKDTSRSSEIYNSDIIKFSKRLKMNFHMPEAMSSKIPSFIFEWIDKNGDGSEIKDQGDIEFFME
jgi:hypothetical protein